MGWDRKMLLEGQAFFKALESRYPGLVERVRRLIRDREMKYDGVSEEGEGFLWEHSVLVAALAFRLARTERENPILAAVGGLFHDAGKFAGGVYHAGDSPEEEDAARLARRVLVEAKAGVSAAERVARALRALYRAGARRDRLADVIHDADFLSKSGHLGVAGFFAKSTLRGRNLERTIVESLSRELTYAAALPSNMRTGSGRRMADRKSKDTLRFHRSLLRELRDAHGLDFAVKTFEIPRPSKAGASVGVRIVAPRTCAPCGRAWKVAFRTETGIKCETLEAAVSCPSCGAGHRVSFCLPELSDRSGGRRP